MQKEPIIQLTSEQQELIPAYCQRWQSFVLSIESLDHQKATEAIEFAYSVLEKPTPEIIFCSSPKAAFQYIAKSNFIQTIIVDWVSQLGEGAPSTNEFIQSLFNLPVSPVQLISDELKNQLETQLGKRSFRYLNKQLRVLDIKCEQLTKKYFINLAKSELINEIIGQINYQFGEALGAQLQTSLEQEIELISWESFGDHFWDYYGALFDFAVSDFNYQLSEKHWEALQLLVRYCGGIYVTMDKVIISDRPEYISLENNYFHAIAEPAIIFNDGYEIYSYRGTIIPEKYGLIPPHKWQPQWIRKEKEPDLKKVLLEGMGFAQSSKEIIYTASDIDSKIIIEKDKSKLNKALIPIDSQKNKLIIPAKSKPQITLTSQQKKKLTHYHKLWQKIALNWKEFEAEKLESAAKETYKVLNKDILCLISCVTPEEAFNKMIANAKIQGKIVSLVSYFEQITSRYLRPESLNKFNSKEVNTLLDDVISILVEDLQQQIKAIFQSIFSESPITYLKNKLTKQLDKQIDKTIKKYLENQLQIIEKKDYEQLNLQLNHEIKNQLIQAIITNIETQQSYLLNEHLGEGLKQTLLNKLEQVLYTTLATETLNLEFWSYYNLAAILDFCYEQLNYSFNESEEDIFYSLLSEGGWIYVSQEVVYVTGGVPLPSMAKEINNRIENFPQKGNNFNLTTLTIEKLSNNKFGQYWRQIKEIVTFVKLNLISIFFYFKREFTNLFFFKTLQKQLNTEPFYYIYLPQKNQKNPLKKIVKKWHNLLLKTEAINISNAKIAIKIGYLAINKTIPKIIYSNLNKAVTEPVNISGKIIEALTSNEGKEIIIKIIKDLLEMPKSYHGQSLSFSLDNFLVENLKKYLGPRLQVINLEALELELNRLETKGKNQLLSSFGWSIHDELDNNIKNQIIPEILKVLEQEVYKLPSKYHQKKSFNRLIKEIETIPQDLLQLWQYLKPELLPWVGLWLDITNSPINHWQDYLKWQGLKNIAQECGWIMAWQRLCIIGDRPSKILLDKDGNLHGESQTALEYQNSIQSYYYHGIKIPEKYGSISPKKWQTKWLLTETNSHLRQILIKGIGYDKIGRELATEEMDSWRNYKLLKIQAEIDDEPIYLLKIISLNTGIIRILRVPPNMESARLAIRWVNWDIDIEEFLIET